jgi:alpha-tubulin suppressor-like RCC1 family protein
MYRFSTLVLMAIVPLTSCRDDAQGPPPPVATVTLSSSTRALFAGESEQFTATTRDAAGNVLVGPAVTWSTSDSTIATVSPTGLVYAERPGSATISAVAEGITGNAVISVAPERSLLFASVAAGGAHTCALTARGAAYCWGRAESGQLGVLPPTTTCLTDSGPIVCHMKPVRVGGTVLFSQLAGGGAHTCGLAADGTAYCWGSNTMGQLGDNTLSSHDAPLPVATTLKFASIVAAAFHTCALTSAGVAYCWGSNRRGQLGDSTTTNRSTPVAVSGGIVFQQVKAGGFNIGHTCGLTSSGDAYCWGDNGSGQLGRGTTGITPLATPAPVLGGHKFAALALGMGTHSCGLTALGAAFCWGANIFGALGDNSFRNSAVPVLVLGGHNFAQLAVGGFIGHTCGRVVGGSAYCWGENEVGAVGDGSTEDRGSPTAVAGGHVFTSLTAGFRHTCGRLSSGAVYCWGSNGAGQLGNDSNGGGLIPVKVAGQP